jgi:hypothetical protein
VSFLFFACLVPAIAFGTIYADETNKEMGVIECIMASGFAGIVYSIFSGQPLCILGGTGPNLAYTVAFYKMCQEMDVDFLAARVWQGLVCSLLTIIFAVTDASALMSHVTRYVEDIFSGLISIIFIVAAFKSVIKTYDDRGDAAGLLTTILFFGTYILAVKIKALKTSKWMNKNCRFMIANFAVTLAIFTITGVSQIFREGPNDQCAGGPVPCRAATWGKVNLEWVGDKVPDKFEPTFIVPPDLSDPLKPDHSKAGPRPWFINPMGGQGLNQEGIIRDLPAKGIGLAIPFGIGMALLNYMDQNLTSKLINRPASGLKKPGGYHLDMMVLGIIIYPVVTLFGLPFPCAATVRSLAHLISLTTYGMRPIPGGGTQRIVEKVIEQRWTHFMIHALMLVALGLAGALKYIPAGAMFGVFLFMGITSIPGNQLFDRMFLWCQWELKSYPRLPYVTRVSTSQLHKFTFIQFICLALLWGLKTVKQTAAAFPFFIAALVFVRKAMPKFFSEEELEALDAEEDLPPDPEPRGENDMRPETPIEDKDAKADELRKENEELKKQIKDLQTAPAGMTAADTDKAPAPAAVPAEPAAPQDPAVPAEVTPAAAEPPAAVKQETSEAVVHI